jgi:hypothetical protein
LWGLGEAFGHINPRDFANIVAQMLRPYEQRSYRLFVEKNPVSRHTQNLRNRVFRQITDCNEGFSKKPGFSPPPHIHGSLGKTQKTRAIIIDQ